MLPGSKSSIRLFRLFGITVFLHWSWFIVAAYQLDRRGGSPLWAFAEYGGLFFLVLLHEFGHSLACRQVGGKANEILLWPLGGVAYVEPPQRPGPVLWSIVAGPLVNLLLIPVFELILYSAAATGWGESSPEAYLLASRLQFINIALLVFNLLPIYPFDGGQILRALLWFKLGPIRSLSIASIVGLIGAGLLVAGALFFFQSIFLGIIAGFALMQSWSAYKQARAMAAFAAWPRHEGYRCPSCNLAPPCAEVWKCPNCQELFDLFENRGACPGCSASFDHPPCPDCSTVSPIAEWSKAARLGIPLPTYPVTGQPGDSQPGDQRRDARLRDGLECR